MSRCSWRSRTTTVWALPSLPSLFWRTDGLEVDGWLRDDWDSAIADVERFDGAEADP